MQGSQVIETKSEQNEQMRKAVNLNKTLVSSTTAPVDYISTLFSFSVCVQGSILPLLCAA